jgi:hypothetical protein
MVGESLEIRHARPSSGTAGTPGMCKSGARVAALPGAYLRRFATPGAIEECTGRGSCLPAPGGPVPAPVIPGPLPVVGIPGMF